MNSFLAVLSLNTLIFILLISARQVYILLLCFSARNNIGVVIALWAPIILVCFGAFDLLPLVIFCGKMILQLVSRYTLWIPKFGMPYSQHCLVVFMVHSDGLERFVDYLILDHFCVFL